MKHIMVGIFAHPDDEAFGPSGTLLRVRDTGYDIHLIVLTDGEAGTNPGVTNLSAVRQIEWLRAASIIGATSTSRLNLGDGKLASLSPDELDTRLAREMTRILALYGEPVRLSLVTFEPRGLTGHHDHIAASEATTRLFEVAKAGEFAGVMPYKLWYYCLPKEQAPLEDTPYYHPQARHDNFITDRVDVSSVLTRKYDVIDCHASQAVDAAELKKLGDDMLSTECFHVISFGPTGLEF